MLAQALESARTDLEDTLLELRHEKLWTDQLLEAIVEGIITLDRHGRINFFSRGAERITGWMRDQVNRGGLRSGLSAGRERRTVQPAHSGTRPAEQR